MQCTLALALCVLCLGSTAARGWGSRDYEDCNNERIMHLVKRACAIASRSPDGLGKTLLRDAHHDDEGGAMTMDFMAGIQEAGGGTGKESTQELWGRAYRSLLRHEHFYAVVRSCCSEGGCSVQSLQSLPDLCPL